MATEGTKFQLNYKLSDGTLINLYASTVTELETGLADLAMNAANIRATGAELNGGAPMSVAAVAQAFNAAPVAVTPAGKSVESAGRSCKHGPMTYRTGTNDRGPWQGWMCPSPKGSPDKCETIWVR